MANISYKNVIFYQKCYFPFSKISLSSKTIFSFKKLVFI